MNIETERVRVKKASRKRMRFASAIDRRYLEKIYEDMARQGWLIDAFKGYREVYKAIEPQSLMFSVVVFQPNSPLAYPEESAGDMLHEFCEDDGWVLAASSQRYHVFYRDKASDVTPIHTDPSEEYRMVRSAINKDEMLLPFIALIQLPALVMQINNFSYEDLLSTSGLMPFVAPILMIMIISGYFSCILHWMMVNRKRAARGEALYYNSYEEVRRRNRIYLLSSLLYVLYIIGSLISMMLSIRTAMFVLLILVFGGIPLAVGIGLRHRIRTKRNSPWANGLMVVGGILAAWFLMMATVFTAVSRFEPPVADYEILDQIPVLTSETYGIERPMDRERLYINRSLFAPLSVEYNLWYDREQVEDGQVNSIDLHYIRASGVWTRDILIEGIIQDRQEFWQRYHDPGELPDYMGPLQGYEGKVDLVYDLYNGSNEMMFVKDNVICIVALNVPMEGDVMDTTIDALFGK